MKTKLHLNKTITKPAAFFALALISNFSFGQTNLIQNPTTDFYTYETGDNADAFDMTPNTGLVDNSELEVASPYKYQSSATTHTASDSDASNVGATISIPENTDGWSNTDLESYISTNYGSNEQPATTGDGTYTNYDGTGTKTRALKFSSSDRRVYQLVQVTMGTSYTFTVDTRAESATSNTQIFILNNEIATETDIDANLGSSTDVDAYLAPSDINSSKSSATENTFTTSTLTFTASSSQVVVYIRALGSDQTTGATSNTNEVFVDNLSLVETSSLSNEFISSSEFSTFPNPVKDVLNIESANYEVSSVTVKNMLGQELISSNDTEQLNVSSLSSGVYLLVIKSGSKVAIKKFIKQ